MKTRLSRTLRSTARISLPLTSAIVALLTSHAAIAGNLWDGGGGNGFWNTGDNWSPNGIPSTGSTGTALTFMGNVQNSTFNNLAATDPLFSGINFNNTGAANNSNPFTLAGNRITLGGNIVTANNTAGTTITNIISLDMILNGDRTITTRQLSTSVQHNLTISGIISSSGAFGLTKDGSATLILSGNNTYTGATTVNAGTLILSGENTYTGATTVNSGTLTLSGNRTVNTGAYTVSGVGTQTLNIQNGNYGIGGTFVVGNNGGTATVNHSAGTISSVGGSGLIIGNGSFAGTRGIYNLSGGSLTSANIVMGVNSGTNAASPNTAMINVSGGALTVGGQLRIGNYTSTNSFNTTNNFTQTAGTTTVSTLGLGGNSANALNSTGKIIADLNLTGGTFTATTIASLSAGGATTIENANSSSINIGGNAQVTLGAFPTARGSNSTATITFDTTTGGVGFLAPVTNSATYMPSGTFTRAFLTANGANFDVGSGKNITIGQVLENASGVAGTLTKSGVGVLTLSGNNTYTGGTTVSAGTLELGNGGSVLGNITNNASFSINRTDSSTLENVISGTGALFKSGTGTVTLSGENTYTGATTVTGGTLTLSGNRTVNTTGAYSVTGAGTQTLNIQNGNYTIGVNLAVGSSTGTATVNHSAGTIRVGGGGLIMGNGPGNSTSFYNLSGGSLTTANIIMGSNSGTNAAAPHTSTIAVSGTGALTVGTLRIGRYTEAGTFNTTSTFNQTAGTTTVTTLGLGGNSGNAANSTGPVIANLNLTGGTFTATNIASISAGGATSDLNANSSSINIGDTAQVTLGAFPTARGSNSTATITFDSGAAGFLAPQVASTNYMPTGTFTRAFLTANGANFNVGTGKDITIGQVLENASGAAGTLTKSGAGVLTLSGNNTYTGVTTVSNGTLVVSNSILSASINSNSVLVNFASPPTNGIYVVLPGALAANSLGSRSVNNLGGKNATVANSPNLVVQVTDGAAVPTFDSLYGRGTESDLGSNGLSNLMNYALGGTGPTSTPDLPVLTVNGSDLRLTATVRNDDPSLRFYGQWTTDLSGATDRWEDHEVPLTPPDLSFFQSVESNKPKKFMRLKVTKQ